MLTVLLLVALAFVACGKSSKSKSEQGKDREEAKAGQPCPALPAELTGVSGLPASFPKVDGLTYTSTEAAGPSTIVKGLVAADLAATYSAYKAALDKAPYSVTKSEKDPHDAEV